MTTVHDGSLSKRLASFGLDAAGIAGCSLITYGADLIYVPAAFLIAGAILLAGAWLAARKGV